MTCRFCKDSDGAKIKYGVRHYAHGRCWLWANLPPEQRTLERVAALLDSLPSGALSNLRPMYDFDSEAIRGTYAAIGMTTSEFMTYYARRREAEGQVW